MQKAELGPRRLTDQEVRFQGSQRHAKDPHRCCRRFKEPQQQIVFSEFLRQTGEHAVWVLIALASTVFGGRSDYGRDRACGRGTDVLEEVSLGKLGYGERIYNPAGYATLHNQITVFKGSICRTVGSVHLSPSAIRLLARKSVRLVRA